MPVRHGQTPAQNLRPAGKALLVECFPASRVEATEALHRSRLGFDAAEFLDESNARSKVNACGRQRKTRYYVV